MQSNKITKLHHKIPKSLLDLNHTVKCHLIFFFTLIWKEYCCFYMYLVSFSIYFKHRNIFVSVDFIPWWMSPYTFCLQKLKKEFFRILFNSQILQFFFPKKKKNLKRPHFHNLYPQFGIHIYTFMLHLPCVSWESWRSSCTWDRTRTGIFWASGHTPQGTGWNTMWTFRSGRSLAFWSCTPADHF